MIEVCIALGVLFALDVFTLIAGRNWTGLLLRAVSVALSLGGEWYWGNPDTNLWILKGIAVAGAVGLAMGILNRLPDSGGPMAIRRSAPRRIPTIGDML